MSNDGNTLDYISLLHIIGEYRSGNIAEASLEELKYFFILSQDLGYMPSNESLISQAETVGRLLNGLIASTQRRRAPPP